MGKAIKPDFTEQGEEDAPLDYEVIGEEGLEGLGLDGVG